MKLFKKSFFLCQLLFPLVTHASFIESTLGTAVVNDATASYYNPAALVLLKHSQIIPQGTLAYFHSAFNGQSRAFTTGASEIGSASTNTHFYSPSFYLGIPATQNIILGLAIVSNAANRNTEENSILRYVESSNTIQDLDVVPSFALKINEFFSMGGGINFSYANFHLKPISGVPGSTLPDSQSNNQIDGSGMGGNVGFLLRPGPATLIGLNYRSMTSYRLSGTSVLEGPVRVVSNQYYFKLWTPARLVFSVNHFVTAKLGFISTVQRIFWSSITNQHIHGIASVAGGKPVILNATVPHYLYNSWLLTLGSHYRITPKWIIRVAGTYHQSPGNPNYQITNGDSIILGASMGYEVNKTLSIDGSYAHAFIKDRNINVRGARFLINGINEGSRDAVSLKLTFNL